MSDAYREIHHRGTEDADIFCALCISVVISIQIRESIAWLAYKNRSRVRGEDQKIIDCDPNRIAIQFQFDELTA